MDKELSIIIPVFQNWKLTATCLAHLFNCSYPKEYMQVYIIDNASTDLTKPLIEHLIKKEMPITYLPQTENLNFCKGINVGLKIVNTPYIMLLNNDVYVGEDCITEMLDVLGISKYFGVVGGMEYLPNGVPSKTKPFIYFVKDTLLDPILQGYSDLNIDESDPYVDVDIPGSACCVIRKEVIDKVGLFDEQFSPCMYEQEDYWMRTKLAGFKLILATRAPFIHVVGATTAFDPAYYQQVIQTNKEKFLKKWLPK